MKIIDVEEKFEPFDVASGLAAGLLAGPNPQYKQYVPPDKPKPKQELSWATREGKRVEGIWDAPYIVYHCKTCSNGGTMTGATPHKTQVVRCCGGSTKVPDYIADEFAKLRAIWEPKHKAYAKAVRKNQEDAEQIRKAAIAEENRRLVAQLRLQSTPSQNLVE